MTFIQNPGVPIADCRVDCARQTIYMMGSGQGEFNVSRKLGMNDTPGKETAGEEPASRALTPAARRALEEAETRRARALEREAAAPKEIGGRGGQDPARYGDWEVKGMASDF